MKRVVCNVFFPTVILVLYCSIAFAQIDTNAREIPWKPIKDTDILWKKRVWREISVYEKQNVPLRNDPEYPQDNVFANVLLSGINAGVYRVYATAEEQLVKAGGKELKPDKSTWINADTSSSDLYFKDPLTKEELNRIITCDPAKLSVNSKRYINFYAQHKNDSMEFLVEEAGAKKRKQDRVLGKATSLYDTTAVTSCVYPQQVDQYGIIEDWIFDKGREEMVVHIVAIAPMVQGKPLFWISYPDIRRYIARYEVHNPQNNIVRYTWDEYFESRQFSSKITKVGKAKS